MFWDILGISVTDDKQLIKNAYRDKLSVINPEDKPEEFMQLRSAYETALKYVDSLSAESEEDEIFSDTHEGDSELHIWAKGLESIYDNFKTRCDLGAWKKHFSSQLCDDLEGRAATERETLQLLMRKWHIPQAVLRFLDDKYGWVSRKDELARDYPKQFVTFVLLKGASAEPLCPVELYEGSESGETVDSFIKDFSEIRYRSYDEIVAEARKLKTAAVHHPCSDAFIACTEVFDGISGAIDVLAEIAGRYPDLMLVQHYYADALEHLEKYELLEDVCRKCLEYLPEEPAGDEGSHTPSNAQSSCAGEIEKQPLLRLKICELTFSFGMCLMRTLGKLQKYFEAFELSYELYVIFSYSSSLCNQITNLRNELLPYLLDEQKARYEKDPSNSEYIYDLAFSYYALNKNEEAEKYFNELEENKPSIYAYHNINYIRCSRERDLQGIITHMRAMVEALKEMKPDGTAKTARRMRSITEIYATIAHCQLSLCERKKAAETAEIAYAAELEHAPKDRYAGALISLAYLYETLKMFDRQLTIGEWLIGIAPECIVGYYFKALALVNMNNEGEAFAVLSEGLECDSTDLNAFLLMISILVHNGATEQAEEKLAFLSEHGVTEERCLRMLCLRAELAEQKHDTEEATRLYREAYERIKNETEHYDWTPRFLSDYAIYHYNNVVTRDSNDAEIEKYIMEPLALALEIDEYHLPARNFRAYIYNRKGETQKEFDDLLYAVNVPQHAISVERRLADIYFERGDFENAKLYYQKVYELNPDHPQNCYALGMSHLMLHEFETAGKLFLKAEELEPKCTDYYFRYAGVCLALGDAKGALSHAEKSVELLDDSMNLAFRYNSHALRVRVYRRLGMTDEALKAADEMWQLFYRSEYSKAVLDLRFEICFEAGRYKQAEKYAGGWDIDMCTIRVTLAEGRTFLARVLNRYMKKLSCEPFRFVPNHAKCVKITEADIQKEYAERSKGHRVQDIKVPIENNPSKLSLMSNAEVNRFAIDCMLAGDFWRAGRLAEKILERLSYYKKNPSQDYVLANFYEAVAYIIQNEPEKALECIERADGSHFCLDCPHSCCMHKQYYTALYEAFFGSREKALEMALLGKKAWPGELMFAELVVWLNSKAEYDFAQKEFSRK